MNVSGRSGVYRLEADKANGARVLVVDDDRSMRESVANNIKSWGFNLNQACDGREALQKLGRFEPHLLVTDPGDAAGWRCCGR